MLTPCLLACRSVPCAVFELLRTLQPVLGAVFLGGHALHPFSNIFTGSRCTSAQSINCYQLCSAFWTQIPHQFMWETCLRRTTAVPWDQTAPPWNLTLLELSARLASAHLLSVPRHWWNSLPAELYTSVWLSSILKSASSRHTSFKMTSLR